MHYKFLALAMALLATPSLAKACSGDCQTGTVAGPFVAAQVAQQTTTAPFPICGSLACNSGSWSGPSIEGIDAQQNIGTQYQFYDNAAGPDFDDNIAVGPTVSGQNAQVLEWVNAQYVQAFDKVTGQPIFTHPGGTTAVPVSVEGLWSRSTQPECATNASGNVQVIYDRVDNEFVISRRVVYTSGVRQYAWCIAASSSSDLSSPTTQWYAYEYRMNTVIPCLPSSNNCTTGSFYYYFPDWPRIGTWSNGFYITFDLQDPTQNYTEGGFEACQLDRADIAKGLPTNPLTCYTYTIPTAQRPSLIHSVDVADIDSPNGPPTGEGAYFLAIVNPSNLQQVGGTGQNVCTSQTTPCTSTQLALFTWGTSGFVGPTFLNVASYTPGCYNTATKNGEANTYCVPEPSTSASTIGAYGKPSCGNYVTSCLDSLGDRMANRLTYNNVNIPGQLVGEFLTASHVVMESSTNQRTGIRYYVIQVKNGKAVVALNSGSASGPPDVQDTTGNLWYLMPSAALDKNGNLGMAFTSSGPLCGSCAVQQPHPAINMTVLPLRASSYDTPTLIVQGAGDQENTDRYGEYAATVIDSSDNLTFYGVGEYFNTNQTGTSGCGVPSSNCTTWQTRIFRGQYGNPF